MSVATISHSYKIVHYRGHCCHPKSNTKTNRADKRVVSLVTNYGTAVEIQCKNIFKYLKFEKTRESHSHQVVIQEFQKKF